MDKETIFIKVNNVANIPFQADPGSAGYDIRSSENVVIAPFETKKIMTGIVLELPFHLYAEVKPRSGMTLKGIITNYGLIDPSYRGQIGVIMTNLSNVKQQINVGDRIAQLLFGKVTRVQFIENNRGEAGFGSTGQK